MNNYINFKEENAIKKISEEIIIKTNEKHPIEDERDIVIVCIGTDKTTSDSFGPFVGQILKDNFVKNVYGDLENPIHCKNYKEEIKKILLKHTNPYVIAVIPTLGFEEGYIYLTSESAKVGAGIGNTVGIIGDTCIKGIVNYSQVNTLISSQTRMHIIYNMAIIVSKAIIDAIDYMKIYNIYNKIIK